MADLGTENYDQEFTLGLIENEQGTLELVNEALDRMENGTFGQCVECDEPISKPRLQAIPYARHCIRLCTEAGGWRMKTDGGRRSRPAVALLVDRAGRDWRSTW